MKKEILIAIVIGFALGLLAAGQNDVDLLLGQLPADLKANTAIGSRDDSGFSHSSSSFL